MNKAFLFVIMLVSVSFVGCIEDSSDELTQESEDETQEPMGVEDNAGMPVVEFIGITYPDMYLTAPIYDSDGYIKSYSISGLERESEYGSMDHEEENYNETYCAHGLLLAENSTIDAKYNCYPFYHSLFIDICYDIAPVNQTITVNVEDNDGNTASAQYVLNKDDFVVCGNGLMEAPEAPIATFFVSQDSANVYHVEVIKVSKQEDLLGFSFFLKDGSGSTYVGGNGFGEVAMQFQGGEEMGIDMTYSADDEALKSRASNVSDDNGGEFPVHFSDNDRDGKLSSGDQFLVYGPDAGPAEDGWKLDIQFDATGDIIGSAKLL